MSILQMRELKLNWGKRFAQEHPVKQLKRYGVKTQIYKHLERILLGFSPRGGNARGWREEEGDGEVRKRAISPLFLPQPLGMENLLFCTSGLRPEKPSPCLHFALW